MRPVAIATGKRFDALGGRRLETHSMFVFETSTRRWAGGGLGPTPGGPGGPGPPEPGNPAQWLENKNPKG